MTTWTEAGRSVAAEFARRAAERFGDRLERIILFGSVARGMDGPDSDVDLIVVATAPGRELRDGLDEIAFDLTLSAHRGPVFLLYPVEVFERARAAGSELIANATREGMTLWMRSGERSSAPERKLAAARADVTAGRFEDAGSRAYYAMLHAARAALAARGLQVKTHSGLAAVFAALGLDPPDVSSCIRRGHGRSSPRSGSGSPRCMPRRRPRARSARH